MRFRKRLKDRRRDIRSTGMLFAVVIAGVALPTSTLADSRGLVDGPVSYNDHSS